MQSETTDAVRQAGNLQNNCKQHRILLEKRTGNENGKVNSIEMKDNFSN